MREKKRSKSHVHFFKMKSDDRFLLKIIFCSYLKIHSKGAEKEHALYACDNDVKEWMTSLKEGRVGKLDYP